MAIRQYVPPPEKCICLTVTLTFDLLILKYDQFIFVPISNEVVNFLKYF